MALYHTTQTVARPAGEQFAPEHEGCFVTLEPEGVKLATDAAAIEDIFGVMTDVGDAPGVACTIATPGFAGIVGVRVTESVQDGKPLTISTDGQVRQSTGSDIVVAFALGNAAEGELVEARLVQPYALGAAAAPVALAAAAPVAVAAAKTKSTK